MAGFALVTISVAAAAALASWLVRRFSPTASGSGIPQVEAVLEAQLPQAAFYLIPIKFAGGLLAIGAGLALGREGPSVQMGGSIGDRLGRAFRRNWPDCRVLIAAGAGAGLSTAFNAPIAGAIFVLEELVRRFEHRIAIAALGASATAIAVARMVLVDVPDFHVDVLNYADCRDPGALFRAGGLGGLVRDALQPRPARRTGGDGEARALAAGTQGGIDWRGGRHAGVVLPGAGGRRRHAHSAYADGYRGVEPSFRSIFLIRFGLGTVSYAARTPGGLFAPLLVLGSQLGLMFGSLCRLAFPGFHIQPEGFAIVGMAALFTGVVRAPITGIVLVVEMTDSVRMLLPMLGACFTAMLVPTMLKGAPIYESLRAGILRQGGASPPESRSARADSAGQQSGQ